MNKTLLYTALFVCCTPLYADVSNQPTAAPVPEAKTSPVEVPAPTVQALPSTNAIPATTPPPIIDCTYRMPAQTTTIDQTFLSTWSKKAAVQSFDFNPIALQDELAKLKACYTEQGWQSFNEALQKSGNVTAIQSQHLTVSSQVEGDVAVNPVKDNQWKVTVPLQVVYQNDKEKLTQRLNIDLLIGRKPSGDLGIMQLIATPRQTETPASQPTDTVPAVPSTQ